MAEDEWAKLRRLRREKPQKENYSMSLFQRRLMLGAVGGSFVGISLALGESIMKFQGNGFKGTAAIMGRKALAGVGLFMFYQMTAHALEQFNVAEEHSFTAGALAGAALLVPVLATRQGRPYFPMSGLLIALDWYDRFQILSARKDAEREAEERKQAKVADRS